jgi:uncharacterized protein
MSQAGSPGKIVPCPQCGSDSVFAPSNPYRPFCSERCKGIDFGAWASETFRVAAQEPPDELGADVLPAQKPLLH